MSGRFAVQSLFSCSSAWERKALSPDDNACRSCVNVVCTSGGSIDILFTLGESHKKCFALDAPGFDARQAGLSSFNNTQYQLAISTVYVELPTEYRFKQWRSESCQRDADEGVITLSSISRQNNFGPESTSLLKCSSRA